MKPHLSLPRILQMNLGFLGLQFSFGLQQGNMAAFYNSIAFVSAFAMVPIARRIGPGVLHAICLTLEPDRLRWKRFALPLMT